MSGLDYERPRRFVIEQAFGVAVRRSPVGILVGGAHQKLARGFPIFPDMTDVHVDDPGSEAARDHRLAIEVRHLFKIFGEHGHDRALTLAKKGATKTQVEQETGCIVSFCA